MKLGLGALAIALGLAGCADPRPAPDVPRNDRSQRQREEAARRLAARPRICSGSGESFTYEPPASGAPGVDVLVVAPAEPVFIWDAFVFDRDFVGYDGVPARLPFDWLLLGPKRRFAFARVWPETCGFEFVVGNAGSESELSVVLAPKDRDGPDAPLIVIVFDGPSSGYSLTLRIGDETGSVPGPPDAIAESDDTSELLGLIASLHDAAGAEPTANLLLGLRQRMTLSQFVCFLGWGKRSSPWQNDLLGALLPPGDESWKVAEERYAIRLESVDPVTHGEGRGAAVEDSQLEPPMRYLTLGRRYVASDSSRELGIFAVSNDWERNAAMFRNLLRPDLS